MEGCKANINRKTKKSSGKEVIQAIVSVKYTLLTIDAIKKIKKTRPEANTANKFAVMATNDLHLAQHKTD